MSRGVRAFGLGPPPAAGRIVSLMNSVRASARSRGSSLVCSFARFYPPLNFRHSARNSDSLSSPQTEIANCFSNQLVDASTARRATRRHVAAVPCSGLATGRDDRSVGPIGASAASTPDRSAPAETHSRCDKPPAASVAYLCHSSECGMRPTLLWRKHECTAACVSMRSLHRLCNEHASHLCLCSSFLVVDKISTDRSTASSSAPRRRSAHRRIACGRDRFARAAAAELAQRRCARHHDGGKQPASASHGVVKHTLTNGAVKHTCAVWRSFATASCAVCARRTSLICHSTSASASC